MIKKIILIVWATLAGIIIFAKLDALITKGSPFVIHYFALGANADHLRRSQPLHRLAMDIRDSLPPGTCVEANFPTDHVSLKEIAFRYELFPVKSINHWPTIFNHAPQCRVIYRIDLRKPIAFKRVSQNYPGFLIFLGFLCMAFMTIVTGEAVCSWGSGISKFNGAWHELSTTYLLGSVTLGLMCWILLCLGVPLTGFLVIVLWVPFFIKAFMSLRGRKFQLNDMFNCGDKGFLILILKIAVIGLVLFFVLYTVAFPICIWDEMYIWLLKAKMFYQAHGLSFDYSVYDHNYYPLLWPLYLAMQYVFIGGAFDEVAKWTSAVIFVALIIQFFVLAKELGLQPFCRWLFLYIYLSCFSHWTMFTALPENFFIALTALSLAFLLQWRKTGHQEDFILLFLSVLGVSALKVEGVLIAVLCFLSLCVCPKDLAKGVSIKKGAMLLLVGLMPIIWQVWLRLHHVPFGVLHLKTGISLEGLWMTLNLALIFIEHYMIIIILALTALLLVQRQVWTFDHLVLVIFCLGLSAFSLGSGFFWRKEFYIYFPEVLTRLFARAVPFIILLWMTRVCPTLGLKKENI